MTVAESGLLYAHSRQISLFMCVWLRLWHDALHPRSLSNHIRQFLSVVCEAIRAATGREYYEQKKHAFLPRACRGRHRQTDCCWCHNEVTTKRADAFHMWNHTLRARWFQISREISATITKKYVRILEAHRRGWQMSHWGGCPFFLEIWDSNLSTFQIGIGFFFFYVV